MLYFVSFRPYILMEGILLLWIYESKCILQWIPGGIICPLTLFNLYYWHIQGCLTPTRRKKNQSTLIFKNVSLPAFWKWKWMFFEKLPEFCFKPPGSCTSGNNFESKKFINKKNLLVYKYKSFTVPFPWRQEAFPASCWGESGGLLQILFVQTGQKDFL